MSWIGVAGAGNWARTGKQTNIETYVFASLTQYYVEPVTKDSHQLSQQWTEAATILIIMGRATDPHHH